MARRQPVTRDEIAKHFEPNQVLAEFMVPFPDVLGGDADLGAGFQRMASLMSGRKVSGAIQFTIREVDARRSWNLLLSPKGCELVEGAVERPQLEILTDADTWAELASGRLAPLEAMGLGTVRVRGDIRLARLLVRGLRNGARSASSDAAGWRDDAMASITGTVRCVQAGEFSGWTQIEDADGTREVLILWFNPGAQIPAQLNAFTRVLHSMWLSLLREAQTSNSTVSVSHPNNSAEVIDVRLGEF